MADTMQRATEPAAGGETRGPRTAPVLRSLWADRRRGAVVAVVLAAGFGVVSGWLLPRGPVTTGEALLATLAAFAVGVGCGAVMGTRWSIVVPPAVFVVAFELARVETVGPTVDAIDVGSMLGTIAFVLGRVVPGLLVLAPMMLGSVYGVLLSDRLGGGAAPSLGRAGWVLTVLGTVALLAVGGAIARPASTQPIVGADGAHLPGSVAELATVPIGGHDQVMMIRGRDVESPVLLYLTGGPGGTDLGAMRRDVSLEEDFVVVTWDQRGAGKSYRALDPTDTLTLDQMVTDTMEVTDYLRDRFDEQRIFLVGQSWGSTLGVLAAQRRPDLYHAFVGVGQMVSQRETDILFWEDTLVWAEETGDETLAARLRSNGPPPYADVGRYDPVVSNEHNWNPYPELDLDNEMPAILFVPEYTWMDRINAFRGFLDTNGTLYPQLQELDFREDVPHLDVPLYMVMGDREARGRAVLADEWFDQLEAPAKQRIVFAGAGHRAHFDKPAEFAALMRQVLDETAPGR